MTTVEGSSDFPHGRPLFRLKMWWGHHIAARWLEPAYAVMLALGGVLWWAPDLPPQWNIPLRVLHGLAFISVITGVLCAWCVHDRNLCLRCVGDSPLLDPQAAVENHRRALRFYHRDRWLKTTTIAAVAPAVATAMVPAGDAAALRQVRVDGPVLPGGVRRPRHHAQCQDAPTAEGVVPVVPA
jgi:hypothetical protein